MAPEGPGVPTSAEPSAESVAAASDASQDASSSPQAAYNDLRRLIPALADELEHLRTALGEHNLWLRRYGHSGNPPAAPVATEPEPDPTAPPAGNSELPGYSASDVPPYSDRREDVAQRRDQLMEWLKEGEDVLREYSTRYAQLATELELPAEDLLGTWREAAADNALPDYEMVEEREELMVGGVGEVPPPYVRGSFPGR